MLSAVTTRNDQEVQSMLRRFIPRMRALARKRLSGSSTGAADEEDIVQAALDSFCKAVRDGRYQAIGNDESLWKCLATITRNKVIDHQRHESRRSARSSQESEIALSTLSRCDDDPVQIAMAKEQLAQLRARLRKISLQKLLDQKVAGYTNIELAQSFCVTTRTIERWMVEIREAFA